LRNLASVLGILLALPGHPVQAQVDSVSLSPSEAYKAALAPLSAARAQPNDLTDADKFALGIGVARASRDCLALSGNHPVSVADPKELLALGQLCLFGQQYEPSRVTLTKYLALPQPQEKKLALLLLVRAHLGLDQPGSAAAEVRSLLHDYPYDAEIHFAIDQVIDASEGVDARFNELALHLCGDQNAVTIPLLAAGKAFEGNDKKASASVLLSDAIRCAALAEGLGKPTAQESMDQLTAIAKQSNWLGTADLAPMQAALERQAMVGTQLSLSTLHGRALGNSTLMPRIVLLTHGTVLLVPITVWSPSAPEALRDLTKAAVQQPIYAITSWSANSGRGDAPSNEILSALRSWQRTLPPHVSILIVPDAELRVFHADSFPAAIVIRDGAVRSNSVLSSRGAERMVLRALTDRTERP
jgi:hypothetical protein